MSRDTMYFIQYRHGSPLGPFPLPITAWDTTGNYIQATQPDDSVTFIELTANMYIKACDSESDREHWRRAASFYGYSASVIEQYDE